MPEKSRKDIKGKTERIELRISAELKQALTEYSDRNLQSVMETTNHAIKKFVGFGEREPKKAYISDEGILPKNDRLEIRVHPELKKMLIKTKERVDFQGNERKATLSAMVISAIMQYISFKG